MNLELLQIYYFKIYTFQPKTVTLVKKQKYVTCILGEKPSTEIVSQCPQKLDLADKNFKQLLSMFHEMKETIFKELNNKLTKSNT